MKRLVVLSMITGFVFLGQDASFATSYDYINMVGTQQTSTNTIQVSDSNFLVRYTMTNGTISDIHGNNQSHSITIHTNTPGNGILSVILPRGLVDSKANGSDDKFFVIVDGQEEPFDETKTTQNDRTLSIPYVSGTQYIEVIGTKAVPEFGGISYIILAIAIISTMILVKTRTVQSRKGIL